MADSYNGCVISLNMTNLNTRYGNGYDYISWPDSKDSINNYIDDSIEIYNISILEDQSEKDFSGEVVVLYNDDIKDYIYNNRFKYGDFYIQVLNKNFGLKLDINKNIIHNTLKGTEISDVNTDTYKQFYYEKDENGTITETSEVVNNYNQINWIIRHFDDKLNDLQLYNCDFILRSIPIFIPSDDFKKNKPVITLSDINNSTYNTSSISINIKYDGTDYKFTLNHNLYTNEFTISDSSGIDYELSNKYITLSGKKIYFDNFAKLLFVDQTVCSIPYSGIDDYLENRQKSPNNNHKKIITKNKYDNLIVSLNNSNNSEKLEGSEGLFHFYLMCDSWNKYHEFCPIDKLSILKKGLYSFRCYDDQTEVAGTINILTLNEQCKLLDNNILVGTNTLINLSNFSIDYSNYESWMSQLSKQNLIEIKIENLYSDLKQWSDHNSWLKWDKSSDKLSDCPLPKNIDDEIKKYYNRVNSDLLIDNIELRKYDTDWNTINEASNNGDDEEDEGSNEEEIIADWRNYGSCTLRLLNDGTYWKSKVLLKESLDNLICEPNVVAMTTGKEIIVYVDLPSMNLTDYQRHGFNYSFFIESKDISMAWPTERPIIATASSSYAQLDMGIIQGYIEGDYLVLNIPNFWYDYNGCINYLLSNNYSLKSNSYSLRNATVDSTDYINLNFSINLNLIETNQPFTKTSGTWYLGHSYTATININKNTHIVDFNIITNINNNEYLYTFNFESNFDEEQTISTKVVENVNKGFNKEYNIDVLVSPDNTIVKMDVPLPFPEPVYNLYSDKISRINNVSFNIKKDYDSSSVIIYESSVIISEIEFSARYEYYPDDDTMLLTMYDKESNSYFFDCASLETNEMIVKGYFMSAEYYRDIILQVNRTVDDVTCTLSSLDLPYSGISYEPGEPEEPENPENPELEETKITKDIMLEYLNVAVQRLIADLKLEIIETQSGENYTRIKNLDNTIDLKNDWIGNIKFIPDDPNYFENPNLTLSIIYKENLDDFNNINYYNSKNEYVSCNYVKNYYLGSKDYSLKTFVDDGILFSFSADYKSPYYVKGGYRESTCNEMFPIVYNVIATTTNTDGDIEGNTTNKVEGLYLNNDEYNFNSIGHFNHVSGMCHLDVGGKNSQIFIVKYEYDGEKYTNKGLSSWKADEERDVDISEQDIENVKLFKTDNNSLYLLPTFLYKTGKDKLAKSSVNANEYTVSIENEPNNFTSRLASLGYLQGGKVYPGSLWNREISEWEGLYLGLLSNLYFSYKGSGKAPYNINYAGYKKYETSFTKDVLVSISPRSLNDCNKYFTIRDANYVEWVNELTKYRTGNINQDLNVNLQLEGIIKNFPMTFNFEYKLPVIDMTEPDSSDTIIHSIYGDTITKIKELDPNTIYTLDGNGNPINVNNYPYIPKCDINLFEISTNDIKYKGKPTTMVCILDLTQRGLKKDNNHITIEDYGGQGTYSILTTQRRNWIGKKFDEYLTGLPSNADFIE